MEVTHHPLVEHLFRNEYGKLVASLTRIFGTAHLQLAEDTVQESLIAALDHWAHNGVPNNPEGWLHQVAKRKALNHLRRLKSEHRYRSKHQATDSEIEHIHEIFLDEEISDSQLRMIFTCCHPGIRPSAQIALILKILGGFGTREVANALLTPEATIRKRIYRAKAYIRDAALDFHVPSGATLVERMDTVRTALYLLFNEGYHRTTGPNTIQQDLCLEAMRLTKLLVDRYPTDAQTNALLALQCFHTSRFDARIDDRGGIVIFAEQDRSRWNQSLINQGMQFLHRSQQTHMLSTYHLEASIAAHHSMAKSFTDTDWQSILANYQILLELKPTPIIRLNIAVVLDQLDQRAEADECIGRLISEGALSSYYLLPATLGVFYMKRGDFANALKQFEQALHLQPPENARSLLLERIRICQTGENDLTNRSDNPIALEGHFHQGDPSPPSQ